MAAGEPSPRRFEATITHREAERARAYLTRSDLTRLDLLPPGVQATDEGVTAHAFVNPDDCARLLRAGFRVELTALVEGPVDPARVMSDEQARNTLVQRLGAERLARGEEA